jgi:hypothetical protein
VRAHASTARHSHTGLARLPTPRKGRPSPHRHNNHQNHGTPPSETDNTTELVKQVLRPPARMEVCVCDAVILFTGGSFASLQHNRHLRNHHQSLDNPAYACRPWEGYDYLQLYVWCFATPASFAFAMIRFLYAWMLPSKCSILPSSQTHKLVQTLSNNVTCTPC